MTGQHRQLILLRHGESAWNAENRFTGWVDADLSDRGLAEAERGGRLLAERNLLPDVVHTSVLRRAIATANTALTACAREWIPVQRSWRLNERHYGALQGKNKAETLAEFGEEQFMLWRRSYDVPPPPIDPADEWAQTDDPRYTLLGDARPATECLADVLARMLPYWYDAIAPDLAGGQTVLVAAHGNSLRALVKHLDGMSEQAVVALNIPTGIPLLYQLDGDLTPVTPGGEYLDPEAAAASIEAVKNQGRR
jgi:2,3-bisphosphoglycerate-dependent phosphoglycerate mutase